MTKKGGDFEIIALDFLENIFNEIGYTVVRKRTQNSGSQDGYDNLIEIVDAKYRSYNIYSECKDYTSELNYTDAFIKLPQLSSTHENIDLVLFISPKRDFSNIFEENRNKPFLERLTNNNYPVTFITPGTNIIEYFTLYPELYKKVYLTDAPEIDNSRRREILNKFEKFIFSDKNLKKVVIDNSDKETYIGLFEKNKFHIERTVRSSQDRELYIPKAHSSNEGLENAVKKSKLGIVLLGGAGYGKSSELKNIAIDLWNKREENGLIPVFFNLKVFHSNSEIENILPKDYRFIPNLVVILDGVDEIENIIDFTNKLRFFIISNTEHLKRFGLKFLISCRTNVYKKYIKNIDDFDIYFLNEVQQSSAIHFLYSKYQLDLREQQKFDYWKHRELLENPFYLELIGKYYKTHNLLLTEKAKLVDEYVTQRLSEDEKEKYLNDINFDKDKIISYTQKVALTLEAIQKPNLNSSEIKRVINVEEKEFSKNPFLEQNLDETWGFVHKNIQEYFVARVLQNLPFEKIINLIRIDSETNKIHPTWYNVTSFLLNLNLDKTVYENLVNWFLENDYELLFNADINRISNDIKSRVLENFFVKNCEEETLWINDTNQIANFSESEANIKYLISKMPDDKIHRRARMSAIKLLSHMDIPNKYHSQIKRILINILKKNYTDEDYTYIKQEALDLTSSLGINEDINFFNEVIQALKEDDHKEIVSAIFRSIPIASFEENIDHFLQILDKSLGNKEWKFKARYNSIISTKESLFELFSKINNSDILLKIYSFLIERHKNYQIKESLIEDFLKHIEEAFKDNVRYHGALIKLISEAVINDKIRYFEDDLLVNLVKSCKIENQVFSLILSSIVGNSSSKHFLAEIVKQEHFNQIIEKFNANILNVDFIREFRNVISHKNIELSIKFEDIIEKLTDYRFTDKVDYEEIEERKIFWKTESQRNFNVLFDASELKNQITKIYEYYKTDKLSFKDIDKFYDAYYKNFNLQKAITTNAKQILLEILRDSYRGKEKLKKEHLLKVIKEHELNLMDKILRSLPEEGKTTNLFILDSQIEFIKEWCLSMTETINDNYINHILKNNHSWNSDKYYLFKTIYKFQKKFRFELNETLLLNMIWFNTIEKGIVIDYMIDFVSIEKINQRILENLKNGIFEPASFCNHVAYCIENNIDISLLGIDFRNKIYDFLESDRYYYAIKLIENVYSNDTDVLTEFLYNKESFNNKKDFLRRIITLMIENKNESIVEFFLVNNYDALINKNTLEEFGIIKYLIALNNPIAFEKLFNLICIKIESSKFIEIELRQNEWQQFSNKEALNDLIKIFELYLITPNSDKLFDRFSTPVRISTDTIINICKNHDANTCQEVLEKIKKINFDKIKEINSDLFYYNKLKNDILEIYYKHKSKPYTFAEALKVLDENKTIFIS